MERIYSQFQGRWNFSREYSVIILGFLSLYLRPEKNKATQEPPCLQHLGITLKLSYAIIHWSGKRRTSGTSGADQLYILVKKSSGRRVVTMVVIR